MTRKLFLVALAILFCSSIVARAATTKLKVQYPDKKNWYVLYGAAGLTQEITALTTDVGDGVTFLDVTTGTGNNLLDTTTRGVATSPYTLAPGASMALHFKANAANTSSQAWDPVQTGRIFDWSTGVPTTKGTIPVTAGNPATGRNIAYKLRVGWAKKVTKLGKARQTNFAADSVNFDKSTVLSAYVAAGTVSKLASGRQTGDMVDLMSKVGNGNTTKYPSGQGGTLAEVTTLASDVPVIGKTGWLKKNGDPKGYVFNKKVGSDAQILAANYVGSEAESPEMEITMAWRHRLIKENGSDTPLPVGAGVSGKWLTSDVVKVGGVESSDVLYALQMTFDNRISLAIEGSSLASIPNQIGQLHIAQLNTDTDVWEKIAANGSVTGCRGLKSLSTFLSENAGATLDELEGAWGVDPGYDTNTQRGKSWAIIRGGGSGIFAVVPEPATILMMVSAVFGAMTYGWRRLSRKQEIA